MAVPRKDGPADRLPIFSLRVFRVQPGTAVIVRMLSESYGGLFTHFHRGKSRICRGQDCPPADHKTDRVWKGYCSAEVYDQAANLWAPIVLEITEHCELDLRGIFHRGQVWELSRQEQPGKKATPVKARLLEERDPKTFPPAFSPKPVLMHMYHVEQLDLTFINPLPPRVMVTHSEGDAPACLRQRPAEDERYQGPSLKEILESRQRNANGVPHNGS